jgi:uncharacterized protein YlxW (UPF0749 family)
MSTRSFRYPGKGSWEWSVAGAAFILGVMIALAYINQKNANLDPDIRVRLALNQINIAEYNKIAKEVHTLREENTKLQNAMGDTNKNASVLNESLQQLKMFAGLTDVKGPGITITLTDSRKKSLIEADQIIHDYDVLHVVNELWAAGAEAIEVNGNRIVGSTSIRCVGPVILCDNRPIASPIHIRAIGDVETLKGGMNLPGGVLSTIRDQDPDMVRLEVVKEHRFKAYAGSTQRQYIKAIEPQPKK